MASMPNRLPRRENLPANDTPPANAVPDLHLGRGIRLRQANVSGDQDRRGHDGADDCVGGHGVRGRAQEEEEGRR